MTDKGLRNRQNILEISCDEYFLSVEELLREERTVTIPARGKSMLPFIQDGDRVELAETEAGKLKRGDIVLARTTKGIIMHRIIKAERDGRFILMGDGNLYSTEYCEAEDIAGTVMRVCRGGKWTDCRSRSARMKAGLWMLLRPVRRPLLLIWKKSGQSQSSH
ncbi:MAG: S24/S26 family peptidase [Candidatus Cryptobacteroides sp.]|nr:S24/S26 family peptidase [Bacteroidales bacterium]